MQRKIVNDWTNYPLELLRSANQINMLFNFSILKLFAHAKIKLQSNIIATIS